MKPYASDHIVPSTFVGRAHLLAKMVEDLRTCHEIT